MTARKPPTPVPTRVTITEYAAEKLRIYFAPETIPVYLDAESRAIIDSAARLLEAYGRYRPLTPNNPLRAIVRGILSTLIKEIGAELVAIRAERNRHDGSNS